MPAANTAEPLYQDVISGTIVYEPWFREISLRWSKLPLSQH